MISPRTAATSTALLLALASITACSTDDPATPSAAESSAPASTANSSASETPPQAAAPEEACPATFTDGRDGEALPAAASDFLDDTPTWICQYEMDADESTDRWNQWNLSSAPVEVTGADKALVTTVVESLEPADETAMCTMDLGPRLLISHEVRDGEQAHLVIDQFGCRDIALAENLMSDTLSWAAERFRAPRPDVEALAALVVAP